MQVNFIKYDQTDAVMSFLVSIRTISDYITSLSSQQFLSCTESLSTKGVQGLRNSASLVIGTSIPLHPFVSTPIAWNISIATVISIMAFLSTLYGAFNIIVV